MTYFKFQMMNPLKRFNKNYNHPVIMKRDYDDYNEHNNQNYKNIKKENYVMKNKVMMLYFVIMMYFMIMVFCIMNSK
jgi:hypothetical protein